MDYKPARLDLSVAQAKKLLSGSSVRLKPSQIGTGSSTVYLHPAQHRLMTRAKSGKKGFVLEMTAGEILTTREKDVSGKGIFGDIYNGLKSGYNWVKSNIIDTPIYQDIAKPVVRSLVDSGANVLKAAVPMASNIIDKGVDTLSNKTQAFGVKRRARISRKVNMLMDDDKGASFKLN